MWRYACTLNTQHCTWSMEKWTWKTSNISIYPYLAPDGVPEVLTGDADGGSRHADHHGHLVVHLEHPVVDVDLVEGEIFHQITQQMRHGAYVSSVMKIDQLLPGHRMHHRIILWNVSDTFCYEALSMGPDVLSLSPQSCYNKILSLSQFTVSIFSM